MTRQAAIARLNQAVGDFIDALPVIEPVRAEGGEWGTHEVLSHLVFWHETYLRIVSAMNARADYVELAGVFRDYNALAVETLREVADAELARRLSRAQEKLAPELTQLPPTARVRIKAGAMGRGPVEFADRVAAHIRGHLAELRHRSRRLAAQPA